MTINRWSESWPERFRAVIKGMGFDDAFVFVMDRSGESFGEMFGAIRDAVDESDRSFIAFSHLAQVFYLDAHKNGKLHLALMEALVRSSQQFTRKGWNCGKNPAGRRLIAKWHWPSPDLVPCEQYGQRDWSNLQNAVWQELELQHPPDDWCPNDSTDPINQEAFRHAWPERD